MSEDQGKQAAPVLSMDQIKAEAKDAVGPQEKPKAIFNADFREDGVLVMELDLKPCVVDEEKRLILRAFMWEKGEQAMAYIHKNRVALAEQRQKITKVSQQGISGFLRKMGRA